MQALYQSLSTCLEWFVLELQIAKNNSSPPSPIYIHDLKLMGTQSAIFVISVSPILLQQVL